MSEPRIVLLDLETLPILREVMRHFTRLGDYPGLTLKASINSIICCGWKVFGEKSVHCINAWDYPAWRRDVNDDKAICEAIAEMLDGADCIVTHNGRRFDWKFLRTRMIYHKLPPLPRIPHIDTCAEAKKNLLMFNNRLNTVARFLTDSEKLENGGWDLWCDVLERKPKAMSLMEKYCKQDVIVLEKVFRELRPFMTGLPNYSIFQNGKRPVCPNCGGTRLQARGYATSKTRQFQRFQCNDCGSWCRTDISGRDPRSI